MNLSRKVTSIFAIVFVVVVALLMFFDVEFLMYYPDSQKQVRFEDVLRAQNDVLARARILNDITMKFQALKRSINTVSPRILGCTNDIPKIDFVFNATAFWPERKMYDIPRDALADELRAELDAMQYPQRCDAALSKHVATAMPAYGFSALLLYLPRLMSYAVKYQRNFIPHGEVAGAEVANRSLCSAADYTCVYEPLTNCTLANTIGTDVVHSHPLSEPFKTTDPLFTMPDKYAHKGWFWWAAQTLQYVARPNERLRTMVKNTKKQLNWTTPMIGIHVRRSDSCRTRATWY